MSDSLTYTFADTSPPSGAPVPSARELHAMGVLGLDMGRSARVTLMNQVGAVLHMPPGGFHGQAKLFEANDIRLRGLLARMARETQAKPMAANLDRAARYTHVNILLTFVSAAREFDESLTAHGTALVNTFDEGGLDFLWLEKDNLGLPKSVTRSWEEVPPFKNLESKAKREVHPANIPARDQLLAYAAQIGASFNRNFKASLRAEFGDQAQSALSTGSRAAVLVWQAYAFLSPGGNKYDPNKSLRAQLGQRFGHRAALGLYANRSQQGGAPPSLDDIVKDESLNQLEWFRSAKTRAAETLFLEWLLKRARQLLP